ncbi:MAG: hypothetical protein NWE92_12920 [Candidatus Bathyarchaeota archaeon]|nr:hypothetical protein [Candidatus Bathyarchaeota archaeon]
MQPEKTQIYLAHDGATVAGLMLVYNGFIAQLRGSSSAVAFMLENLSPSVTDIQVPKNCEATLSERYPSVKLKEAISLLRVRRGGENLHVTLEPQQLMVQDAEEIAALMREAYPQMWSEMTSDFCSSTVSGPSRHLGWHQT